MDNETTNQKKQILLKIDLFIHTLLCNSDRVAYYQGLTNMKIIKDSPVDGLDFCLKKLHQDLYQLLNSCQKIQVTDLLNMNYTNYLSYLKHLIKKQQSAFGSNKLKKNSNMPNEDEDILLSLNPTSILIKNNFQQCELLLDAEITRIQEYVLKSTRDIQFLKNAQKKIQLLAQQQQDERQRQLMEQSNSESMGGRVQNSLPYV